MRGALIVFEGGDRCGKTTQCKRIVEILKQKSVPTEFMNFPDRTTATGRIINDYLLKKVELSDKAVHLLFSANRWESEPRMRQLLNDGVNLIVDRYSFSGVAFSAAKKGMAIDWCKHPEIGLPKPDLVCLLKSREDLISQRDGWGAERYEKSSFQAIVNENFQLLKDDSYWKEIDAAGSIEEVTEKLLPIVSDAIDGAKTLPLKQLW